MKISHLVVQQLLIDADVDAAAIAHLYDEPEGSKVLEVGAHDEPLANVLADMGNLVYGVDLREYDDKLPKCNYTYLRADFCDMPPEFVRGHYGTFDVVISVSAIEHFGMGVYGEGGSPAPYYDVVAMRQVWNVLRPGGTAYVTVPCDKTYGECWGHWRTYDRHALYHRIIQDFTPEVVSCVVSGPGVTLDGVELPVGRVLDGLNDGDYDRVEGSPTHVSAVMKLVKVPAKRLAPSGR